MTVRNITSLDFDGIKNSFKTFLQSQSEFVDYDFEGSAMNVLMDVLAYNTHYTGYYANMLANESFLDSALIRSSIVSKAKELGYIPNSSNAAKAHLTIQINSPQGSPASITIPTGTSFNSSLNGTQYTFVTTDTYVAYASLNYVVTNVAVVEGIKRSYAYTVNTTTNQNFVVPTDTPDIDYLKVYVQTSTADTNKVEFTRYSTINQISATANLFYLFENRQGRYEVQFGDGIISVAPQNGNVVVLDYLITAGPAANGCSVFTLNGSISNYTNVTITTTAKASGGSTKESNKTIQFLAPKYFQTQNRAITPDDYRTVILKKYTDIRDAKVWGGEDNIPPTYGKVFVSLQPYDNSQLTTAYKNSIVTDLRRNYATATVIPEVVDQQITYLKVATTVTYDPNKLLITEGQLNTAIIDQVVQYGENNLDIFDTAFRFSKFSAVIDATNSAILSNTTTVELVQPIDVVLGQKYTYTWYFNNPIQPKTLASTGFLFEEGGSIFYLDDDGSNLRFYTLVGAAKVYSQLDLSTSIDYDQGIIKIQNIKIQSTSLTSNQVAITITPTSTDVVSKRNQVLVIDSTYITATSVPAY